MRVFLRILLWMTNFEAEITPNRILKGQLRQEATDLEAEIYRLETKWIH